MQMFNLEVGNEHFNGKDGNPTLSAKKYRFSRTEFFIHTSSALLNWEQKIKNIDR